MVICRYVIDVLLGCGFRERKPLNTYMRSGVKLGKREDFCDRQRYSFRAMRAPEHLNALRAFEATARHESFSAAAAELHVTPAAVGQLVRNLEASLGTPLFHRSARGRTRLVPTEAAQRALPDIRAGFDRLSLGVA